MSLVATTVGCPASRTLTLSYVTDRLILSCQQTHLSLTGIMDQTIVIFGASGDLTSRKLVPALYQLFQKNRLPKNCRVVGISRSPLTSAEWQQKLEATTAEFSGASFSPSGWNQFASQLHYLACDINRNSDFGKLRDYLDKLESDSPSARLYYLATLPHLYTQAVTQLGVHNMATEGTGPRRVVIEKPFGTDLTSAHQLNQALHNVFGEKQIFRIDHYLGKETVQNLLVLRFANSIFEPIWNRNYIDHVQITVAEELMVGRRGGYYDSAGVLRDFFQNHLLQLLTITAMEAPPRFAADLVRDEKVKVLQAVRPLHHQEFSSHTIRGQYEGYRREPGVSHDSQTATYAAIQLQIDNWRWNGVPFYLRSGKAMSCRTTQIVIQFRKPPHLLFGDGSTDIGANRLVIQIQPAEGIQLHFQSKVPDGGMQPRLASLDFRFQKGYSKQLPDAYQPLLLDAINGDASLFARSDEVELAWQIVDPILNAWQNGNAPPLELYEPGEWGPATSHQWMQQFHREWFDVCPIIH